MSRARLGIILAASGGVIFGVSAALAGFAIESVDPLALAGARVGIAGICLAPLAWRHRTRIAEAPLLVASIGILQVAINASLYLSLERIGVGPAVGLEFLAPILVVAWDRLTGAARPRRVTWAAVVAAVVGVGLVVEAGDLADLDLVGVAAGLAAAVGLATYLRLSEHVGGIVGGLPLAAGAITIGGAVGLVVAQPWTWVGSVGTPALWAVVALGTIGMALPLTTEIVSLSMTPARVVGVIITIEPVAAAVTAWWFLDQSLSGVQWVGLVLIVAAVAAVSWTTGRQDVAVGTA